MSFAHVVTCQLFLEDFDFGGFRLCFLKKILINYYIDFVMGKDKKKKGTKANIFKVAGAKSLKKTKAKAVNLGLKNMKQKVAEIDKQLVEIKSDPQSKNSGKQQIKPPDKRPDRKVTKEEVAKTFEEMVKMDL